MGEVGHVARSSRHLAGVPSPHETLDGRERFQESECARTRCRAGCATGGRPVAFVVDLNKSYTELRELNDHFFDIDD